MAKISDEQLDEFIELSREKNIEYKDRQEAYEAASNVVDFIALLLKIDMQEKQREARLLKEPNGFAMIAEGRTCLLCRAHLMDEDMWYDQYGMKCMRCQKVIDDKIVPGDVLKEENSFITSDELAWKYNIRFQTLKKLIRQEKLKVRIINGTRTIHVLLVKENPDWLQIISQEKSYKEN